LPFLASSADEFEEQKRQKKSPTGVGWVIEHWATLEPSLIMPTASLSLAAIIVTTSADRSRRQDVATCTSLRSNFHFNVTDSFVR